MGSCSGGRRMPRKQRFCKRGHSAPRRKNGHCSVCWELWRTKTRKRIRALGRINAKRYREGRRNRAIEFLGGKCLDCGCKDKRVLEFDHVFAKREHCISLIITRKWEVIEAELRKCELVCANCHMIRTYNRVPRISTEPVLVVQGGQPQHFATVGGERRTLKEWSLRTGIALSTLYKRYRKGERGTILLRRVVQASTRNRTTPRPSGRGWTSNLQKKHSLRNS